MDWNLDKLVRKYSTAYKLKVNVIKWLDGNLNVGPYYRILWGSGPQTGFGSLNALLCSKTCVKPLFILSQTPGLMVIHKKGLENNVIYYSF